VRGVISCLTNQVIHLNKAAIIPTLFHRNLSLIVSFTSKAVGNIRSRLRHSEIITKFTTPLLIPLLN
jgi:hypothetical protein